jgi:DNA-binding GntR family transcriptional regulator
MTERIQPIALYQQVADRLREAIYHYRLVPGQAIDEVALCEELGISRTPLREALKVLHADGLIDLVPRRGAFVKQPDATELDELFPVMAVLEGLAARETAQRLTPEALVELEAMHARLEDLAGAGDIDAYYDENFRFHEAIQRLSGNRWLQHLLFDLRGVLRLARHRQLTLPGRLLDSLEEHRRIMTALRQRDDEQADQAMQNHLLQQHLALKGMTEPHVPAPGRAESTNNRHTA